MATSGEKTLRFSGGWARVTPPARRAAGSAPPAAPAISVPPDGPLRGSVEPPYPEVGVMAFHYRNPVSGREPPELLPP